MSFRKVVLYAVVLITPCCVLAQAQFYTIQDLGTLGGTGAIAMGMNNKGHVVGMATNAAGLRRAFIWTHGTMTDLGTLPGHNEAEASDLNDSGLVVGRCFSNGYYRAFMWTNGVMTNLPTEADGNSQATGLNDKGVIVGLAKPTTPQFFHACIWTNRTYIHLDTLDSSQPGNWYTSSAWDMNNHGKAVGSTHMWNAQAKSAYRAFMWEDFNTNGADDDGEMQILGTLGGDSSIASAINDFGDIVGHADTSNGISHAYLLVPHGTTWKDPEFQRWKTNYFMLDLGAFPGGAYAEPFSINNSRVIVGSSEVVTGGLRHAFISYGDGLLDLNDMINTNTGWELNYATEINNSGQICGYGTLSNETRAFLLTPTGLSVTITRIFIETNKEPNYLTVVWRGEGSNLVYILEDLPEPADTPWNIVAPTNQWSTYGVVWSNVLDNLTNRQAFRVWAQTQIP